MPSPLRLESSFQPTTAYQYTSTATTTIIRSTSPLSPSPRPSKKQRMSLSQTYHIASTARAKLGREACRADHNLRLLVGHANLLDALTLELRDAEREQEAWFNASVKRAQDENKQPRRGRIQWADTIVEETEMDDDSDSDSDSDSEYDEAEFQAIPLRRIRSPPVIVSSSEQSYDEEDDEEEEYEDVDDTPELALTRTYSHPPELVDDSDSDDDSPPASPPQPTFEFDEKTAAATGMLELSGGKMLRTGYILRTQNPTLSPTLIEAY